MVVQARIARTGVQIYKNEDGTRRREYRSPAEVGHADALASLKLIPFTVYHPPVMVTAENATTYTRGTTGETVTFDGKWVSATIAVQAKDAVEALGHMQQISVGYDCDLDMTPGVSPEGEHYDCSQLNIRGNHVALVPDARAGAEAAVRMDAAFCEITPHKDSHMDTTQLTAALTKALADVAAQTSRADTAVARADAAERDAKDAKASAAKLEAERDAQKERADAADKARKDATDATPLRVRARVELEGAARRVLGARCDSVDGKAPEIDLNTLTDRAVMVTVIKEVTNTDALEACKGKDDAYIDVYVKARYDGAIERAAASADTFRATRDVIETHRHDAGSTAGTKKRNDARAEMIKANREGGLPAKATK